MTVPDEESYIAGNPALAASGRAVVLSGCSGGGKSTLLAALARRGFPVQQEAGRQIVREQMHIGGDALPWLDAGGFVELAAARTMHFFNRAALPSGPMFFDRSLVDLVSFLDMKGLGGSAHLRRAVTLYRYAPDVFVVPPWPELYVGDTERQKPFEEACREYDALVEGYVAAGYRLVEIPKGSVDLRVEFVLRHSAIVALRPE